MRGLRRGECDDWAAFALRPVSLPVRGEAFGDAFWEVICCCCCSDCRRPLPAAAAAAATASAIAAAAGEPGAMRPAPVRPRLRLWRRLLSDGAPLFSAPRPWCGRLATSLLKEATASAIDERPNTPLAPSPAAASAARCRAAVAASRRCRRRKFLGTIE